MTRSGRRAGHSHNVPHRFLQSIIAFKVWIGVDVGMHFHTHVVQSKNPAQIFFCVDEAGFEPAQLALQTNALPLELFVHRWPGEIRTHSPRIKSAVRLTIELRTNFCFEQTLQSVRESNPYLKNETLAS